MSILLAVGLILLSWAAAYLPMPEKFPQGWDSPRSPSPVERMSAEEWGYPELILLGAREEVKSGTYYDAAYRVLDYPGGDVNPTYGACTDMIIRALRRAGFDLQELIHEDMRDHFTLYPQLWEAKGPDPNIDHRRTQNQMFFFERFGETLTLDVAEADLSQWRHGDFVYWRFPGGQQHTGVISDLTNEWGLPLVIHNNSIAREEDCLQRWVIIGHYRFPKEGGKQPSAKGIIQSHQKRPSAWPSARQSLPWRRDSSA